MMPRIRTVKPELFNHEGLFKAEVAHQLPLRLAFIALFTCCDREGRFRWKPGRLKLAILPYDEVDISSVLDALVTNGFVKKYEYQDEMYGCIPSWLRHQHINHREAESELPSLEDLLQLEITKSNENKEIMTEPNVVIDACSMREARVPKPARACPGRRERKGRERKGREGKGSIVASVTRPSVELQSIQKIFEYWKAVMNHPNANLDHKRKKLISKALNFGYDVEQLCHAIAGCSNTPHNVGDNDRGQRYDGLHIILRDADQIDRFIHNYEYPPHPLTEADRRTKANVQTLQGWMNKTIAEEETYANH